MGTSYAGRTYGLIPFADLKSASNIRGIFAIHFDSDDGGVYA